MTGLEGQDAFEEKLRIGELAEALGDVGEKAHAFGVLGLVLEKGPAVLFGGAELAFAQEAYNDL